MSSLQAMDEQGGSSRIARLIDSSVLGPIEILLDRELTVGNVRIYHVAPQHAA